MGELVVAVCAKVWKSAGFLVCGGAAEADLWRGGGQGFERADSWRCGACQRSERAAGGAASGSCHPRGRGRFEIPRSTRESRQQRPRASRFRGSVPAGGLMWNLARCRADRDAKIEPAARKMTDARRSHLMHSMIQGFILSDSQKGSAPMRRGLRA